MNDFWSRKVSELTEQQHRAEEEAMAAQLTYRNPNLPAGSQECIDIRRAQVERNHAMDVVLGIGQGAADRLRREAHLRVLQRYGVTVDDLKGRPAAAWDVI
ncbi:hypothetical protein [Streptomyces katrae]|uniref:Uncharacterized protein n=1 Tax=Streptomyces katrae TaxID=68223 RepID=A0A0F4JRV3_9ACTN|nr:hypothetical protein [Streptomyces katrae]KJY37092.1 hypothetical protein VR44_06505 [Streptomyces katrae]